MQKVPTLTENGNSFWQALRLCLEFNPLGKKIGTTFNFYLEVSLSMATVSLTEGLIRPLALY